MNLFAFQHLDVWKRACCLACDIYTELATCRDFGLKDQMTRAAVSIASNIAEGEERESKAESARFLYFAKGSSGELATQIYIAIEIGVIEKQNGFKLIKEAREISAMLGALIKIRKGSVRESAAEYNIKPNI
ncbi:four helix bundle protein [Shewanella fidelis]|uniref:Four helix bundle protein n=1 Tax=Shewanella fidelis TaxID=173509 RepID=A0AAW8NPZ4_9GAMM|nr:four helix bundle protein [Shewanella fidelis]MDR8524435.1 four helix bundle protein [Shewanella fidelis]MDW4811911.1 four helix bundle protein [Shewanella fidelis]MDW4817150.1 four helix bundle protein [Shewanella fidelis]MDW4821220.1 four helix bundle protein [Shewanella fidelis]MDW4822517.1 four helix bundle protein [Shewanella fidelis]